MSNVPTAAFGGAAAHQMATEALKAMGPIVVLEPEDFLAMLAKNADGLVIHAPSGMFSKNKYITAYKGLIFFTKTKDELMLPADIEVIRSKKIAIPQI